MPGNEQNPQGPMNADRPKALVNSKGLDYDKDTLTYRLQFNKDLDADPAKGVILVGETYENNELHIKAQSLTGEIIDKFIKLDGISVNAALTAKDLITHKKLILAKIRAAQADKEEKAQRIFKNEQELKQQQLDESLKKRNESIQGLIQNKRPAPKDSSNVAQMQHLTSMGMEGLAMTMLMQEIAWLLKCIFQVQFFSDLHAYKQLSSQEGGKFVYDPSQKTGPTSPKDKPLYAFKLVGDKIVLDVNKEIALDRNNQIDQNNPNTQELYQQGYSNNMIIMANGYLPPPTLLGSFIKETSHYIQLQMGHVIDQQARQIEEHFYNQVENKKESTSEKDDKTDMQIAMQNAAAARPKPPTPK